MAATSGSVMLQAASHLNDRLQTVYTPTNLMPFLNMAIQELHELLSVHNANQLKASSIVIEVPAGSVVIPQMPVDYYETIHLLERANGGSAISWEPVTEANWIDPTVTTADGIIQWSTRGSTIEINPPVSDREVMLQYLKGLTEATGSGTTVNVEVSKRFLALVTARNAARDMGNSPGKASTLEPDIIIAKDNLTRIVGKTDQNFGVRRLPYRGRSG